MNIEVVQEGRDTCNLAKLTIRSVRKVRETARKKERVALIWKDKQTNLNNSIFKTSKSPMKKYIAKHFQSLSFISTHGMPNYLFFS